MFSQTRQEDADKFKLAHKHGISIRFVPEFLRKSLLPALAGARNPKSISYASQASNNPKVRQRIQKHTTKGACKYPNKTILKSNMVILSLKDPDPFRLIICLNAQVLPKTQRLVERHLSSRSLVPLSIIHTVISHIHTLVTCLIYMLLKSKKS